jgi:hypothetical protein
MSDGWNLRWVVVAWAALTTLHAAEPALTTARLATDKGLYDFGEPVILTVEAEAVVPTEARLILGVRRGTDPERTVADEVWRLEPGPNARMVAWDPGLSEYGHLARVRLLATAPAETRELGSATTLFEVCHDWPKVARWACAESCKDCAPDDIRARAGRALSIEQVMQNLRERYLNTYELYCFPPHPFYLDVKEDVWPPPYLEQAKRGLVTSAAQVRRTRDLLRQNGFKLVIYNEMSSYLTSDPRFLKYNPNDGQLSIVYPMDRNEVDPNSFAIADLFGRELAGAIRRFGFDAVFMDSGSQSHYSTYWCKDRDGNRLTDLLPGEIGEHCLAVARTHTAREDPGFRFVSQNFNASVIARHHHTRLPLGEMEQAITRYYHDLKWDRYAAAVDMFSLEYTRDEVEGSDKAVFSNRLDKLMVAFNTLKALTHRPQLAWFQINHPNTNPELAPYRTPGAAKPILAAIFAARTSLADYGNNYGGHLTGPADDPVNRAFIDYHRFILRYSQYLYDLELEWLKAPEPEIEVQSAQPLCWQHTVYRRRYADREETVANLLQFPPDGLIYAVRPTELPVIRDTVVSWPAGLALPSDSENRNYLLPATENRTEVFAMSPDADSDDPVPLAAVRQGGRFSVTVPSVQTWTLVVIRRHYPEYDRARFAGGR